MPLPHIFHVYSCVKPPAARHHEPIDQAVHVVDCFELATLLLREFLIPRPVLAVVVAAATAIISQPSRPIGVVATASAPVKPDR